uniref:Isoleucine--tRNA ligase n=1 Tax=Plectus sambesii TaxID=2011161 RepID=A0A914X861_9BILA
MIFKEIKNDADLIIEGTEIVNKLQRGSNRQESDRRSSLTAYLTKRPSWCISRQRVWGVPIPAFYREDGSSVVTDAIVNRVADLVERHGTDCWWTMDTDDFLTADVRQRSGLAPDEKLTKGNDIMDVWLDSGVAWHCASDDDAVADLVVEGDDQFRGWFQSLLWTSVAADHGAPYRRVLVHGFCVDDDERKMSKSIGNVIDPDMITDGTLKQPALGADFLRLWVASHGSESNRAKIGPNVIADLQVRLAQIRSSLRFLLGGVEGYDGRAPRHRRLIDMYMLLLLDRHLSSVRRRYEDLAFRAAINESCQFMSSQLSAFYIATVKDRLYCHPRSSDAQQSVKATLDVVGRALAGSLAPMLPHLAVEFFHHHPLVSDAGAMLREPFPSVDIEPTAVDIQRIVETARSINRQLVSGGDDPTSFSISVRANSEVYALLSALQAEPTSIDSELVELCGVSAVTLEHDETVQSDCGYQVLNSGPQFGHCRRCRKKNRIANDPFCSRCAKALDTLGETALLERKM